MAMPALDLSGQKFGYLTVLRRFGTTGGASKKATWLCRCQCGAEVVRISQNLRLAEKRRPNAMPSCGCMNGEAVRRARNGHGRTNSREWVIWRNMRMRCSNPADKDWKNYGARGIRVCPEWDASFQAFWHDMGCGYSDGMTIERIDVNGHYTKANCRWATMREQSRNKRDTVMVQTPIGAVPLVEVAERSGLKYVTLYARYRRGDRGDVLLRPVTPPDEILEMARMARWPSMI